MPEKKYKKATIQFRDLNHGAYMFEVMVPDGCSNLWKRESIHGTEKEAMEHAESIAEKVDTLI